MALPLLACLTRLHAIQYIKPPRTSISPLILSGGFTKNRWFRVSLPSPGISFNQVWEDPREPQYRGNSFRTPGVQRPDALLARVAPPVGPLAHASPAPMQYIIPSRASGPMALVKFISSEVVNPASLLALGFQTLEVNPWSAVDMKLNDSILTRGFVLIPGLVQQSLSRASADLPATAFVTNCKPALSDTDPTNGHLPSQGGKKQGYLGKWVFIIFISLTPQPSEPTVLG
ncbi:hypothetical protein CCUS01_10599 [Colletotrichum cuscutae]|uniref:Uncharacterized protein n=1 Tax=Colletotrichum cuscutae TaxID=1209917 RepID=A0AAI9UC78_9PEZI|nr:hypothetical protein CCUS01_10599 [Colletotrichum cuscutae]